MPEANDYLNHTVAFRVTESQWQAILAASNRENMTVAAFAKAHLFEHVGIKQPKSVRSNYGHKSAKKARASGG